MDANDYRPLSQNPNSQAQAFQPRKPGEQSSAQKSWLWLRSKLEALAWVCVFFFVYHKTRFARQLLANPKVNQLFLMIFLMAVGANFSIIVFVSVVLPRLGFANYEDYSPLITPLGSVVMLLGFFSCVIAVYPVYGVLSLLIVPALGMGFMMISQFIPFKGNLNSLTLFLIFGILLGYSYYFHD